MKIAAILLSALFGVTACAAGEGATSAWDTVRSDHFIVHFTRESTNAGDVARSAEAVCVRIRDELGFQKRDDFWLWERRVKIYLYPSRESFVAAVRAPAWAAAQALAARREIAIANDGSAPTDRVLRHEITHLVLREFVGFDREIPGWLGEGISRLMEKPGRGHYTATCAALMDAGLLFSLEDLAKTKPATIADPARVPVFYAQSASLVGYLLDQGGADSFRKLCGALRDGKSLDDALRFTYPGSLRSLEALETAWKRHLSRAREAQK